MPKRTNAEISAEAQARFGPKIEAFAANYSATSAALSQFGDLLAPMVAAASMLDKAAANVIADPTNQAALDYLREARAMYADADDKLENFLNAAFDLERAA